MVAKVTTCPSRSTSFLTIKLFSASNDGIDFFTVGRYHKGKRSRKVFWFEL
jgi:hypothetical protein